MCVDEGHIKFVVYCCCLFSLQHLGQCGMYRNHSLNTGLDQSRVWWLLYSNLQPITSSQPLLSWSRFFLIFQRNIGLCLKIMSPLLNHPVFLCVCNNAGILFPVFYHHSLFGEFPSVILPMLSAIKSISIFLFYFIGKWIYWFAFFILSFLLPVSMSDSCVKLRIQEWIQFMYLLKINIFLIFLIMLFSFTCFYKHL